MTKIEQCRENVAADMDSILRNFTAGSKITVIVRPPGGPEREFLMTSDSLDEVSAAIERSKARESK